MRVPGIKIKFILSALLISLISFGVAAFLSNLWMQQDFQKDYSEKAELIGTHVIHELEMAMLYRNHEGITDTLGFYRKYKDVEQLRVFNPKGKEVLAHEEGSPQERLNEVLGEGRTIHFRKQINGRDAVCFIFPIKNRPECHRCHDRNETLRGALLLSLSLQEMEQVMGQQRTRLLVLFGLIAAVIGTMTFVAANRFLVRRLKPIQAGAEAIEKGDFGYQIPIESDDEIGHLTRYVNRMAEKLQTFFKELEEKNRQLTEQFMLVSRSQKEWQETFDWITDPMAVVDQTYCLIKANKALKEIFKKYFSHTEDEAIRKDWNEYFGQDFLPYGADSLSGLRDRAPTTREIHHPTTGKVFEVSLFPYYSQGGDFTGSVVILKDVTEKKEDEMRLIMNDRLVALGQMASGIAHELNTPLATIAACNEGLLNRLEKENIGSLLFRSYLKIIEEEIERCKKITTGMLSFVRRSDHDKREVDVNEVLDKTIDMITFQGRLKEVEVLRNFQRRMPKILGDDGELMQVFLAIVVNALDAMQDKGTLTLETGSNGNTLFIKIGDSGPGIPPDIMNRIFDPFYTTKSERGGTGLGLSIADKIVKNHNGKIEVTSEEGRGTTFRIIFPL